jgi:hypothetical protein
MKNLGTFLEKYGLKVTRDRSNDWIISEAARPRPGGLFWVITDHIRRVGRLSRPQHSIISGLVKAMK